MKKNTCENCSIDFERPYVRRFCCKPCWYKWNAKNLAAFNDTRFQWKNCTEEEKLEVVKKRFDKYVIKKDGCWGWTGHLNKNGYPNFRFGHDGKGFKERYGHRISWLLYRGEIPEGKYLCHQCDNPVCTNPDHLFLASAKENSEDMVKKDRGNRGSRHGNSKLTESQVKEIRIKFFDGVMIKKIMQDYKIGRQTAHDIKYGNTWKHVTVEEEIEKIY
jgi:hypothetical protein